jgi:hypothetical protein
MGTSDYARERATEVELAEMWGVPEDFRRDVLEAAKALSRVSPWDVEQAYGYIVAAAQPDWLVARLRLKGRSDGNE